MQLLPAIKRLSIKPAWTKRINLCVRLVYSLGASISVSCFGQAALIKEKTHLLLLPQNSRLLQPSHPGRVKEVTPQRMLIPSMWEERECNFNHGLPGNGRALETWFASRSKWRLHFLNSLNKNLLLNVFLLHYTYGSCCSWCSTSCRHLWRQHEKKQCYKAE